MLDYATAFSLIDRQVRDKVAEHDLPGLAIALTGREGLLWQAAYGYADLEARNPVSADTRFEIASVGKSFTCIALLKLHEMGQLDLHAPVTEILPWVELNSDFEPVTTHHLMTHSAGLGAGIDFTPCARYEVYALRESKLAYAPGEHFHYSNVGYKLLSFILEDVTGRPYGELLEEWILDPLGMLDSDAQTTHDSRARLATGYVNLYDDRPWHRGAPIVPAPWFEYGTGDGSPVCNAADLAAYLRMLLNGGLAPTGRQVLSADSFQRMIGKHIPSRDGHYGYGLWVKERDGRTTIGHNGGAIGYLTTMLGDLDSGHGVVIFTNSPAGGEKDAIAEYALDLLHAVQGDAQPPPGLPVTSPTAVEDAAAFAGRYQAGDKTFTLHNRGRQLIVEGAGGALEKQGPDRFVANHPALARHLLLFERQDNAVVGAKYGADVYVKQGSGWTPQAPDYPAQWDAYTGHYRAHNPWFTNFRVFVRWGKLMIAYQMYRSSVEESLVAVDGDEFQMGEGLTPERVTFDTVVNGQALRAKAFGGEYYRYFTP